MLQVSPEFKTAIQAPTKRVLGYIKLADGTEVHPSGDLVKFSIQGIGELLKPSMKQLDLTLVGDYLNLKDQSITVFYGVEVNGTFEYEQVGVFTILEVSRTKDTDDTVLKGYDNMVQFMKPYQPVSDFPTTLQPFLQALAAGAGVPLATSDVYNGALSIPEDYWATIPEATYRDVLKEICEVSVSNARMNATGELELIPIDLQTGETLTYENLLEYKLEESWGKVNSLVLSRQPQNDDVFLQDEEAINTPTNRNILDLNKFSVGYSQGGV